MKPEVKRLWRHSHDKFPDLNGEYRYVVCFSLDGYDYTQVVNAVDEMQAYVLFLNSYNTKPIDTEVV